VNFEGIVVDAIRASVDRLQVSHMDLFSGAGHDARNLAAICPSGMIFTPCENGISHNEIENAAPADLADGARVIAQVLVDLASV
jgi:N-carbamoyl-L-amino-acid hydrolase